MYSNFACTPVIYWWYIEVFIPLITVKKLFKNNFQHLWCDLNPSDLKICKTSLLFLLLHIACSLLQYFLHFFLGLPRHLLLILCTIFVTLILAIPLSVHPLVRFSHHPNLLCYIAFIPLRYTNDLLYTLFFTLIYYFCWYLLKLYLVYFQIIKFIIAQLYFNMNNIFFEEILTGNTYYKHIIFKQEPKQLIVILRCDFLVVTAIFKYGKMKIWNNYYTHKQFLMVTCIFYLIHRQYLIFYNIFIGKQAIFNVLPEFNSTVVGSMMQAQLIQIYITKIMVILINHITNSTIKYIN